MRPSNPAPLHSRQYIPILKLRRHVCDARGWFVSIVDLPCVCSMAIENAIVQLAGRIRRRNDSRKLICSRRREGDYYHKEVNIRRESLRMWCRDKRVWLVVLFQASACLWQAKPAASGVRTRLRRCSASLSPASPGRID